jgi:hypothetical protein
MKKGNGIEMRVVKIETVILGVAETLARLDTRMEAMDHVIRGNGAPGLSQKVGELKMEIIDLKGDKGMLVNAVYGACGGLIVGLIMFAVQHFSK